MWAHARVALSPYGPRDPPGVFGPHDDFLAENVLSAPYVAALAIGGSVQVACVNAGTLTTSATTAITGIGFQPDVVLLSSVHNAPAGGDTGTTTGTGLFWGAADAAAQFACGTIKPYNSGGGTRYFQTGETLPGLTLDSLDADGFTVTVGSSGGPAGYLGAVFALCIRMPTGLAVKVGTTQQPSTPSVVSATSFGFDPGGVFVTGTEKVTPSGSYDDSPRFVFGFADRQGNQCCSSGNHWPGAKKQSSATLSDTAGIHTRDSQGSSTYTNTGVCSVEPTTDGIDFDWATCDGNQRTYGYVAFETDQDYIQEFPALMITGHAKYDSAGTVGSADATLLAPSVGYDAGFDDELTDRGRWTAGWYGGGTDSIVTGSSREVGGFMPSSSFPVFEYRLWKPWRLLRRVVQIIRW